MANTNNTMFSWVCQHTPKVPDTQEAGTGGSLEPKQHNEMCGWVAQWQSENPASTRPWVQSPPGKLYKTLRLLQLRTRSSTAVADTEISVCSGILPAALVTAAFRWTPPCCPWKQSKVESTRITLSWRCSVSSASSTTCWRYLSWCLCPEKCHQLKH